MNILIVSPGVYPVPAIKGGAVENLIEMLIKNENITKKHKITVYTVYENKIEELTKNIKCEFKFIKTNSISYQFKRIVRHIINRLSRIYIGNQYIHTVEKQLEKEKNLYDIIIIENEPQYGLILKKVKGKAKLILHLHNDYLNIDTRNARQIKDCYDRIFSISKYISDRVNAIDANNSNSKVFYNGIDTNRFNTQRYDMKNLRKKYGFKENDFIFMYSGRLAKEKGIKELIEAFCGINNQNAKLLIVGKKQPGQEQFYNNILNLSKRKKDNIIFKGYIEYDVIPELYSLVDVGVIPSVCNEAFGLSLVEFLACGKPVIVSNRGALPEILKDSECGEIAECNDNYVENLKEKMLYFLNIEKKRMEKLRKEAIEKSRKYSKEIYINNFLNLIEEETNGKQS